MGYLLEEDKDLLDLLHSEHDESNYSAVGCVAGNIEKPLFATELNWMNIFQINPSRVERNDRG